MASNPENQLTDDDILSTVDYYRREDFLVDGEPVVILSDPEPEEISEDEDEGDDEYIEEEDFEDSLDDDSEDEATEVAPTFSKVSDCTTLQELRKARGFTQAVMAERLNVAVYKFSRWEKGATKVPAEALKDIARELGASVEAIIQLIEPPKKAGRPKKVKGIDDRPVRYQLMIRPPKGTDNDKLLLPAFWNRKDLKV